MTDGLLIVLVFLSSIVFVLLIDVDRPPSGPAGKQYRSKRNNLMSNEAMNRDELIDFIRDNFDIEDIWPDVLVFESEWEVDDWAHERLDASSFDWESVAEDAGWINPEFLDQDAYDQRGIEHGLKALPLSEIERYHDDNHHSGAIRYCEDPLCQAIGVA